MIHSLGAASTFFHFAVDDFGTPHSSLDLDSKGGGVQTDHGDSSPQVFLKASLCGRFFAVISALSVAVFSAGQRRVPLGRLQRSRSSLEFGLHSSAVWSVDGSMLYVITKPGNTICVFRFAKEDKKPSVGGDLTVPRSVIGVGETSGIFYSDDAEIDDDDEEEDSDDVITSGKLYGQLAKFGSGVRPARRKVMVLSENHHQTMKNTRQLSFAAVLRLPVAISDISLSLEYLILGCRNKPAIFTMQQAQPRHVKEVIEFADFVYSDRRSWLSNSKRNSEGGADLCNNRFLFASNSTAPSLKLHMSALQENGVPFMLTPDEDDAPGQLGVRQFELNESLDLLAIVMTSGAAALFAWKQPLCASGAADFSLLRVSGEENNSPIYVSSSSATWVLDTSHSSLEDKTEFLEYDKNSAIGICLRKSGVQLIKMNRPRRLAAIAMSNGLIDLISLAGIFNTRSTKRIRRIHPCDALSLTVPLKSLGNLTCLRWSGDGLALVVSWSKVGPVVFSHSGK